LYAAVCHHDHQIPQAQFEARVPAYAQNDDLSVEMPPFEQILDRDEPLHLFIIARHPHVCTRAGKNGKRRAVVESHENRRYCCIGSE